MEGPIVVDRTPLAVDDAEAAVVAFNRPEQMNAIDGPMIAQLGRVIRELNDDTRVRVVFLTGRGQAFSAGADLKAYLAVRAQPDGVQKFIQGFHRAAESIRSTSKPVVALVNGTAVAGGLEIMLACDFAYAASSALIGDAHLKYGQMGGGGTLTLLPALIGPARARELLYSARLLTAQEALEWGLVNRVVADGDLLSAGLEFGNGIAAQSPAAIGAAKSVLNAERAVGAGLDAGLILERQAAALHNLTSGDALEGLNAFTEGREPRFRSTP